MNMALKMTAAYFEAKGLRYKIDEENNIMRVGVGGLDNKGDVSIFIFFDQDETSVAIRSFKYCTFSEDKLSKMYEICSNMNNQYRWIKFYVQEEERVITLATDAVIQMESCGEEILELVMRLADIADSAYPHFMKAIWQ